MAVESGGTTPFDQSRELREFMQESPLRPELWSRYIETPGAAQDVLLLPYRGTSAGALSVAINAATADALAEDERICIYNQSIVAARFTFATLVKHVLPMSLWWQRKIAPAIESLVNLAEDHRAQLLRNVENLAENKERTDLGLSVLLWLEISAVAGRAAGRDEAEPAAAELDRAIALLAEFSDADTTEEPTLFAIACDRVAEACVKDAVRTVKADAAREVFDISCEGLAWAVVDSGVDDRHPAFRAKDPDAGRGGSRIEGAYDFTTLGHMLRLASSTDEDDRNELEATYGLTHDQVTTLAAKVRAGDDVDWRLVADALAVEPGDAEYMDGLVPHGTHVAGILGGAETDDPESSPGLCPDIKLFDLRVLKELTGGRDTEFHVISALQFVRYLSRDRDTPRVHGVNLSLSLRHSVKDYACGQTPLCEECDRLVASGIVVVAAAGNFGFDKNAAFGSAMPGAYQDTSITDPGNAESVITVGATHGKYPHRYGVSYFSSRGPTGDGRAKPDLVAPGESIVCPGRNGGYETAHGTSMAAPHVSGAAALLMARHAGLIGEPARVKKALCDSATDLKRGPDFQGSGLVDVLRAIQSI